MRNIPLFTTDNGIASLVLEEIPYKKEAYIRIQSTDRLEQLLSDCTAFCRSAGAEYIYAAGHECLSEYPLHTAILRMSCMRSKLPQTDARLVPVQKDTLDQWRDIYNERMASVLNSATMTLITAEKLLESGSGYFVYRDNTLLGIGKASGDTLDVIISLIPGSGREVLLALCSVLTAEKIFVEVVSSNIRAVKLYERLGFVNQDVVSQWYKIV